MEIYGRLMLLHFIGLWIFAGYQLLTADDLVPGWEYKPALNRLVWLSFILALLMFWEIALLIYWVHLCHIMIASIKLAKIPAWVVCGAKMTEITSDADVASSTRRFQCDKCGAFLFVSQDHKQVEELLAAGCIHDKYNPELLKFYGTHWGKALNARKPIWRRDQ